MSGTLFVLNNAKLELINLQVVNKFDKYLFFVRHGETKDSVIKKISGIDEPLSSVGVRNAEKLAKRLSTENIDTILSSDYLRACQTAKIISGQLGIKVTTSAKLQEKKTPRSLIGESSDGPKVKAYVRLLNANAADPNWHYEDDENPTDVIKRVQAFLDETAQRKEKNICAVTHSGLLRYSLAPLLLRSEVNGVLARQIFKVVEHGTTAITLCGLSKKGWELITWNDQSHLG